MKKLKFLLLVTFIALLSSCTSNDNNVNITDNDLIGEWNLTEFRLDNGSVTYTEDGNSQSGTFSFTGSNFNATLTFGENPKVVTAAGTFTISSTATYMGQTETDSEDIDTSDAPNGMAGSNWSLNNGVLTFSQNGENVQAEVIGFDGTVLELKAVLDQDYSEGDQSISIRGTIYMTLSK